MSDEESLFDKPTGFRKPPQLHIFRYDFEICHRWELKLIFFQRWDAWENGIGSNGQSLPGVEAKFVINDTRAAAIGEEGELWIRGPTVFNGYRGEPELTAGCMTKDEWFKTGGFSLSRSILPQSP